ncbi:MAG: hypothetical protein OXU73_01155 [Candidatus Campbellbacteria bacterium]|nr:hypothetical protein [Candidatus Campbellbacteria bacterium]
MEVPTMSEKPSLINPKATPKDLVEILRGDVPVSVNWDEVIRHKNATEKVLMVALGLIHLDDEEGFDACLRGDEKECLREIVRNPNRTPFILLSVAKRHLGLRVILDCFHEIEVVPDGLFRYLYGLMGKGKKVCEVIVRHPQCPRSIVKGVLKKMNSDDGKLYFGKGIVMSIAARKDLTASMYRDLFEGKFFAHATKDRDVLERFIGILARNHATPPGVLSKALTLYLKVTNLSYQFFVGPIRPFWENPNLSSKDLERAFEAARKSGGCFRFSDVEEIARHPNFPESLCERFETAFVNREKKFAKAA